MTDDNDKIAKFVVDGEQIILIDSAETDDYVSGKLVLTSKRLFLCGAKSTFNRDYVIKKELELKEIANVQGDFGKTSILGVAGTSELIIEPKIGENLVLSLDVGSMAIWDYNNAAAMQMTKVTNWINSIKLELLKVRSGF